MKSKIMKTFRLGALLSVAVGGLIPGLAYAQAQADPQVEGSGQVQSSQDAAVDRSVADQGLAESEIVVTGTLIRGIAPPGASPIQVSEKAIEATGAGTVAQVLQTIPQLASFGGFQVPNAASPEVAVNRPSLRGLSSNTAGGSTTLVLMDGHRLVGMGSNSTAPDPDVIPPGVLRRVEIVPDGGSAIYGSDAVAGVLNFITISRFDGLKVDASYGFADDYYRWDANVTAGRDWGDGSLFASYSFAKGDQLLGGDRDFVRRFPITGTGQTEYQCSPGNVGLTTSGPYFSLPTGASGAIQCDPSDFASYYPAYQRHSLFAGLTQQLSDSMRVDIRAFYTNRKTEAINGPYLFTQSVTAAQALALAPAALAGLGTQTVFGAFGGEGAGTVDLKLEAWGVTPTITAQLSDAFQLSVLYSHGESTSNIRGTILDTTALGVLVGTGAFNPYNPGAASSATLASLTNLQTYGRTRQSMDNVRAVIDGDLFDLPGGTAKVAFGAEYSHETFNAQNGSTVPGFENTGFAGNGVNPARPAIPRYNLSRNIKSVFGEIVAPILGGDSYPELTVSAAARYDSYNDVGDTFNPRFAATFKPVEWVSIRGAWGTSFNAPSLADDARAASSTVFFLPSFANGSFRPPADLVADGTYPAYNGQGILAIRGNAPGIRPQTATTWTVGFDVTPPFIEGVSFGATYFNIDYKDFIGLPPFQSPDALYRYNGNVIQTVGQITQAEIDAIVAQDTDGIIDPFGSACPFGGAGGCNTVAGTYAIFDARKRNLGRVKLDGIDFRLSYEGNFGFGTVFANVNASYEIGRDEQTGTSPFINRAARDTSRFKSRSTVGAQVGNLLGQVTWNHLSGYQFSGPVGFSGTTAAGSPFGVRTFTAQTEINAFNTFDLFFKYDVKGSGLTEDLSFTLNVENVFDQDPPEYRGGGAGGTAGILLGRTLGRLFQIGVSKQF